MDVNIKGLVVPAAWDVFFINSSLVLYSCRKANMSVTALKEGFISLMLGWVN